MREAFGEMPHNRYRYVGARGLVVMSFWAVYFLAATRNSEQNESDCLDPKFRNELYDYREKTKWLQRPETFASGQFVNP